MSSQAVDGYKEGGAANKLWDILGSMLFFVVAAVAFLLVKGLINEPIRRSMSSPSNYTIADFERQMAGEPDFELFEIMKADFPTEYRKLTQSMLVAVNDRSVTGEQVQLISAKAMQNFMVANQHYIFFAPESHLVSLADAHSELFQTLQSVDVSVCAVLAKGQLPTLRELDRIFDAAKNHSDFSVLKMSGISAGKVDPVRRLSASESEFEEFWNEAFMALDPDYQSEFEASLDNLDEISDDLACEFQVVTMKMISELPDSESAYWYAQLHDPILLNLSEE